MHSTLTETTVSRLACTFEELVSIASGALALYATPTPDGRVQQVYLAARPQGAADVALATLVDFEDFEGQITAGWETMDALAMEEYRHDGYRIVLPRHIDGDRTPARVSR
jgi:hypothetical protein